MVFLSTERREEIKGAIYRDGKMVRELPGGYGRASFDLSSDGTTYVIGSGDFMGKNQIQAFDCITGKEKWSYQLPPGEMVGSLAVDATGERTVVAVWGPFNGVGLPTMDSILLMDHGGPVRKSLKEIIGPQGRTHAAHLNQDPVTISISPNGKRAIFVLATSATLCLNLDTFQKEWIAEAPATGSSAENDLRYIRIFDDGVVLASGLEWLDERPTRGVFFAMLFGEKFSLLKTFSEEPGRWGFRFWRSGNKVLLGDAAEVAVVNLPPGGMGR